MEVICRDGAGNLIGKLNQTNHFIDLRRIGMIRHGLESHSRRFDYITCSVTSKKSPNVYKSCPKMIPLEKLKILTL